MVRPTTMISSPYCTIMILVLWRQISSHSNGMIFRLKVKYKCKNVVFSFKTACVSEAVSDTAKVIIDH